MNIHIIIYIVLHVYVDDVHLSAKHFDEIGGKTPSLIRDYTV